MASQNQNQLHRILQISAEEFGHAVKLLAEFPSELYEHGLSSCERWLSMLKRDIDQVKKDVLGVNQHGEK